jgi:mono/diheme cytochrome c family protein
MNRFGLGLVAALLLTLWFPVLARAADAPNPAKAAYLKYCSACHGDSGKGDGVVSGFMTPRPTDLTQLAKKAGGTFPATAVMQGIDGTKSVRGHGDADMPVWGELFRRDTSISDPARDAEVRAKVQLIADYVATLQAK